MSLMAEGYLDFMFPLKSSCMEAMAKASLHGPRSLLKPRFLHPWWSFVVRPSMYELALVET